jgi:hypothetical protein
MAWAKEAAMESHEANPSYPLPAGNSARAAAITLCVGVGLVLVCVLVDRVFDVQSHGMGGIQVLLAGAGLLGVYLVAPLLGLIAVSSARGWWQEIVAAATHEHPSVRTMARRFFIAALLFAAAPLVPSVASIVSSMPFQYIPLSCRVVGHVVIALLGLAMGWISLRLFRRIPGARLPRMASVCAVVVGLASVAEAFGLTPFASYVGRWFHTLTRQQTFAGDSGLLERTVVVPTLDSPCPPGKNVVWCSSFQLAWNEIRDNVIGAPFDVTGAEDIADRLNQAPHRASDLEAGSYYAAGGWTRDGIVKRIEKELGARFPRRELPDFNEFEDVGGILAYSYLTANVPFTHPFRQLDAGFTFTDSQGVATDVSGFGLWEAFLSRYEDIREQVEVLYVLPEDPEHFWGTKEYALDLCRDSKPYQVVVAVVEPKASLAETYEHIQRGMERFRTQGDYRGTRWFQGGDELRVPDMFYRIDHRFAELVGKMVANVGMPITEAMQTIEFRLDRSGAMIESEAFVAIKAEPRQFLFNRPFLVYMKKRDAERPFFVMWVDNAELLVRK